MKITVSGISFEVDYDNCPIEGVIINEVAFGGQDFNEFLDQWVLDAIREEIIRREAHERNYVGGNAMRTAAIWCSCFPWPPWNSWPRCTGCSEWPSTSG